MQPRIYTYKITFEEIPHWYWGVHKEKRFGEAYSGSPVTHRWMWKFYTPKIQILEFFPSTSEGWKQAQEVEKRLIAPDLNNFLCLNESCGGMCSIESSRRGALNAHPKIHSQKTKEGKSVTAVNAGKKAVLLERGCHDPDYKNSSKRVEDSRRGGQVGGKKSGRDNVELGRGWFSEEYRQSDKYFEDRSKTGKKSGAKVVEERLGIHSDEYRNSPKYKDVVKKAGLSTSSQLWESKVDGFVSNAGAVARYNIARGWDPSARRRLI
jgi:hypothetical protein